MDRRGKIKEGSDRQRVKRTEVKIKTGAEEEEAVGVEEGGVES